MAKRRKKSRQHSLLLPLIAVMLFFGIAAEGFLLYQRFRQPPQLPAAEFQSERNPEQALTDALQNGDYTAAAGILQADFADADVPQKAVQLLQKQTEAVCADYDSGSTDAETALQILQAIRTLEIPAVSEDSAECAEQIRLHEAAKSCMQKAAAYAEAGEYEKAVQQYRFIPKTEKTLYADAQKQISVCNARRLAETEAKAETLCAAEDYDAAADLLKQVMLDLPDADALQEKLDAITEKQQSAALHTHLKEARLRFDEQDYPAAFAALRQLPDVPETAPVTEAYRKMYLLHLQSEAHALMQSGKLDDAEAMIAAAEQLVPESELPAMLRTELAAYQPVSLSALETSEFADFSLSGEALTDAAGTEYPADGNLYLSYEGDLSGRQRSSAEFRTNGLYSRLNLTAAPKDDFAAEIVFLEISGDGKRLETYAVSVENGCLQIELDITGVQVLRLRVQPYGQDDLRHAGVILADGTVRK
ncbi:MAG: hypothetical protein IKQ91_11885 [Oscillospiraceae bacterium]|nr:hypothetical protein [Oscillospiraceae bacterium]